MASLAPFELQNINLHYPPVKTAVGPAKQTIYAHEEVLVRLPYFEGVLGLDYWLRQPVASHFEFLEDGYDAVLFVIRGLHFGFNLPVDKPILYYARIWVFANRIGFNELADLVIAHIPQNELFKSRATIRQNVEYAYLHSGPKSKLRLAVMQWIVSGEDMDFILMALISDNVLGAGSHLALEIMMDLMDARKSRLTNIILLLPGGSMALDGYQNERLIDPESALLEGSDETEDGSQPLSALRSAWNDQLEVPDSPL